MVISCAVKGVHSSRLNRPDLNFHSLPKNNSYRAKRLDYEKCNKESPQDKNFLWCLQHFEVEHFQRYLR